MTGWAQVSIIKVFPKAWNLWHRILGKRFGSRLNLTEVDLSGINLSSFILKYARLSGINLSGADLTGTNLCFTNLRADRPCTIEPPVPTA